MKRPTRHSYSSISTYEECPAKYAYSYLYNLPWPSSAAMERGTRLHKLGEDYFKEAAAPIPYDLRRIGHLINTAKARGAEPEQVFLVTHAWAPTEDQSKAWVKAIVDYHWVEPGVVYVRDFKSGREYPSHREQLELYSILGLLKYPHVERAESAAVYIDGGYEAQDASIIRPMLPYLINKWQSKIVRIEQDNDFIANPGGACRWCPYAASAGGPCGESARAGK